MKGQEVGEGEKQKKQRQDLYWSVEVSVLFQYQGIKAEGSSVKT